MSLLGTIQDNQLIMIILAALILIVFIWNIILSISIARLKGKYKKMMRGGANNLEKMISDYMSNIDNTMDRVEVLNNELINLKEQTERCIQKVNVMRYNAFSDTGSDLSYSIALLDNYNNGVIITSIYGRNESVTYAKPVENGTTKYPLSVEEEIVLDRCLKTKR